MATAQRTPQPPALTTSTHSVGRVLGGDDDEHSRELAMLDLQKEGFEVFCAMDGTSAAQKIREVLSGGPEAVVTGGMTVLSG